MVSIYDVEPRKLIEEAAKELKKMPEMAPPEWAAYVKTGRDKERPPAETNWWYIRSAAVLRSVYKLGPIGVSKLRTTLGFDPLFSKAQLPRGGDQSWLQLYSLHSFTYQ